MITLVAAPWHERGHCRTVDPELFFPDSRTPGADREAKRICSSCPVKDPCLRDALAAGDQLDGVWGGKDQAQRRRLKLTDDGQIVPSHGRSCTGCGNPLPADAAPALKYCDDCRAPRTCVECSAPYEPSHPDQRCCSRTCAGQLRKKQNASSHPRPARRARGRELQPIKHGTPAGYKQHLYRGEAACAACREAANEQGRERTRRRREQLLAAATTAGEPRPLADLATELATPA